MKIKLKMVKNSKGVLKYTQKTRERLVELIDDMFSQHEEMPLVLRHCFNSTN